jgi:hypothetical protein
MEFAVWSYTRPDLRDTVSGDSGLLGFSIANVRASGGVILTLKARDADGAAQMSTERMEHFVARSSVATTVPLQPWPVI